MIYMEEKNFIITQMKQAYEMFYSQTPSTITQKTEFDLVTELDCKIEEYLIRCIKNQYPQDNILSEEFLNTQKIIGRTWTIDPIDGTCNFAHGMKLFGLQCALLENSKIVMSAIYLPHFQEEYFAIKDSGAFLNGKKIEINKGGTIENAIVSFGDYTHGHSEQAQMQHYSISYLHPRIAKIRMFGAACIDFSYVASGKTDATVVMTKNLWDIAPGILLCKEAGTTVTNIKGEKYTFDDIAVVISSTDSLKELIKESFNTNKIFDKN